MKLKPSHKKLHVLAQLEALARTLEAVLDVVAAANEERDDRPRRLALTLARWAREEISSNELGLAVKGIDYSELARLEAAADPQLFVWESVLRASLQLVSARQQVMHYPTHAKHAFTMPGVLLAQVLLRLGEEPEAAASRIEGTFAQYFAERTGQARTPLGIADELAAQRARQLAAQRPPANT